MQLDTYTNDAFANGTSAYDAEWLYAEPYTTFHTSDEEARAWVREARQEELRERSGYYSAAQLDKTAEGVAGGWADAEPLPDHESDIVLWNEHSQEYVLFQDGAEVDRREEREAAEVRWCRRDEIAAFIEQKRRTEGDQHRADGDYWGAGPVAEKRWLDATISQLRVEAQEWIESAVRRGATRSEVVRSAQFAALFTRRAQALRHRHNFKRYVEALKCDPELGGDDFAEHFAKAEAWRRESRLSYEKASATLAAIHSKRWLSDPEWVGVEGLIAA